MGSSLVLNRRPKVPAEDTAAFGAIAERFRRAGALEQAVSLCRDGLKKFPDHVSARVTLGWSLLDLGKYDEARIELEQVMRRAPDNLAAIRGLAELHDRFEHTLNLPMDGPGQWPPPPDSVDGDASATDDAHPGVSEQFKAEVLAEPEFSEPAMAPAAMGLPLWTPDPVSPQVEVASAPEVASVSVTAGASGMSSVREIDAFAGAPVVAATAPASVAPEKVVAVTENTATEELAEFEMDAPVVAVASQPDMTQAEDLGVTDDALAALIAEAESLDAAAALELGLVSSDPVFEPTIELESATELESVIEPEVAFVEPPAGVIETELTSVEPEVAVIEPEAALVEPEVAVVETEAAVVQPEIAVVEPEVAVVEPEVAVAEPEVAVVEPEAAMVEPQAATSVAEVIAFARPTPAVDPVEVDVEAIAAGAKAAATLTALEQMLRRVQTRRRELMTQSVA